MPQISVIVPVYNTEKYLHRCIDSILSQTFTDFELLLINDGSKDNSGAICDEYAQKDNRVRVFHKENGGVSSARKFGVENARGTFITFLDSDDTFIEEVLISIAKEMDSNIDILVTSCKYSSFVTQEQFQEDLISNKINAALHGRFFRNDIISESLLDIPRYFVIGEDLILNLCSSLYARRIKYLSTVIYKYNLNVESITQNFKRTWEYERKFHLLIRDVFLNKLHKVSNRIYVYYQILFLQGCKLAILDKSRIDYTDPEWKKMKDVLNEHREMLWWDERLTIDIRSSWFCRNLIRILYKFI